MAMASRWMAAYFNRPGFEMMGFDTYALAGDGCMMEGVSNEAASLAGHLGLSNLCWIYDNNTITIEGRPTLAFTEDVGAPLHRARLGRHAVTERTTSACSNARSALSRK